tara:strand:+ start:7763 stop:8674 length:912 start_codon:yes stop_codon:yes gene_type:complete
MFTLRKCVTESFEGLTLIDEDESEYQKIQLFQDESNGAYCLFLNDVIQNSSEEAYITHELMVDVSVKLCNKNKVDSILILGGGDGYPAMYALKYDDVYVTNVEIDKKLVDFIKDNKHTRKLTNDAFNNPALNLKTEDAYSYIYKDATKYDVIVHDIEMATNQNHKKFENHDMYIFEHLLSENGVLNYTDHIQDEEDGKSEMINISQILMNVEKKQRLKKFNILMFTTSRDFKYLQPFFLFDTVKTKEKYPKSEVGIAFKSLSDIKCGNEEDGEYGEEFYMYISKNGFNRNDLDIHFEYFNDLN